MTPSAPCLQVSLLGAEELVRGRHDLDGMLVLFTPQPMLHLPAPYSLFSDILLSSASQIMTWVRITWNTCRHRFLGPISVSDLWIRGRNQISAFLPVSR